MPALLPMIAFEEGYREKPYLCSNGYPTIGYGKKLGGKCSEVELKKYYQFTVPEVIARQWLMHEIIDVSSKLNVHKGISAAYGMCNYARKSVMVSMAYQMGVDGLARFSETLDHIKRGEFAEAAMEMLDSKWARDDSPVRANRHAEQMRAGEFLQCYN